MTERPWVVMRSKNDADLIRDTMEAVRNQDRPCRIINIDSGSTDGTIDIIKQYTDRLIEIRPEQYVAGWVLNLGMKETDGEHVVFLNSDATPTDNRWLSRLLEALDAPKVAAVYGRQTPRPDAWPLFARETDRAFGPDPAGARWGHFFSMANSAIRRSVWQERPFRDELRYAEDADWTYWARGAGYEVRYVPEAAAMHSHNYSVPEACRRQFGDAYALADLFPTPRWRTTFAHMVVLSSLAEIARDAKFCLGEGRCPQALLHSLALRPAQRWGRYRGYWAALRKRQ